MAVKNKSKNLYEIGCMVHLEGYLQHDMSPRTFFGVVTGYHYDKNNKEWKYDVTINVNNKNIETDVKENAILIKKDLN